VTRLRKLFSLSAPDWRLLASAAFLCGAVRVGLWLLPLRAVQRVLCRIWQRSDRPGREEQLSPERIAWAVNVASRFVPGSTCLTTALATRVLLERRNHRACLYLGLSRTPAGGLTGHAWVESGGKVVMGGRDFSTYVPLASFDGRVWDAAMPARGGALREP
jgi:hypothetical protein